MAERKRKPAAKAEAAKKSVPVQWTKEKRDVFFTVLSELCNVTAAAKAAGFDDSHSVYRQKAKDADFRARFEAAVGEGYARLELEMLERGRFGEDRPPDAGTSNERLRQIPTALAMSLLKLHQSGNRGKAPAAAQRPMRGAKLKDELEARLSEINRRLGGEG